MNCGYPPQVRIVSLAAMILGAASELSGMSGRDQFVRGIGPRPMQRATDHAVIGFDRINRALG